MFQFLLYLINVIVCNVSKELTLFIQPYILCGYNLHWNGALLKLAQEMKLRLSIY